MLASQRLIILGLDMLHLSVERFLIKLVGGLVELEDLDRFRMGVRLGNHPMERLGGHIALGMLQQGLGEGDRPLGEMRADRIPLNN